MNIFDMVPKQKVPYSAFNLSHSHLTTCDLGELIPIYAEEVIPGDILSISANLAIRFQPLLRPLLHEVNAYLHFFDVPYRILDDDFPDILTGGEDGTEAPTIPTYSGPAGANTPLDYMGLPLSITFPSGFRPIYYPLYAYNAIYNFFYRYPDIISEVNLSSNALQKRLWERDYFTSALEKQQRGTMPSLPLSGVLDIDGKDSDITLHNESDATDYTLRTQTTNNVFVSGTPSVTADARWGTPSLEVDISSGVTYDIDDLRTAFAQQRFLELNNVGGGRYHEFMYTHFNIDIGEHKLQEPSYIGGSKQAIIFSEVLQTESSDASTPQGEMAGHGISAASNFICKHRFKEHGVCMGILSIMPRQMWNSQGIDKRWLKTSKWDFYNPVFANLSEQAVYEGELYASATLSEDQTIFGYQGAWNQYRQRTNYVTAGMRSTHDTWHISRQLGGRPTLNSTFLECDPRKDWLSDDGEDAVFIHAGFHVRALRPMPLIPTPQLKG